MIPFSVLRTAMRYAVPLACVFALGAAAHELLILGGVELAHGDQRQLRRVGTMLIFVLIVLVQLTVVVVMLALLRDRLRPEEARPSLIVTVTRALPPFVVIYLAWNLIAADAGAFGLADIQRNYDFDKPLGQESDAGRALIDLSLGVSAAATAVALAVRILAERWYERRGNPVGGVLAAFGEAAFTVFGLSSLAVITARAVGWLTTRTGVDAVITMRETVVGRLGELPGADAVGAAIGTVLDSLPLLADAVALPLLWLVVVALVYGHDVFEARQVTRGTRFEGFAARRLRFLPAFLVPLEKESFGWSDKYMPVLIAFRLVLRRGPMVLGVYVLLYAALNAAETGLYRAAVTLIGPDTDPARWPVLLVPVDLGAALVHEVLRVTLLAIVMLPVLTEAGQGVTASGGSPEADAAEPPTAAPPPPPGPPRQGRRSAPAPVPGPR